MLAGGDITWSHYMVLTIFPVAVVAARVAANPSYARVLVFAVTVLALDNVDATNSAFPEGMAPGKISVGLHAVVRSAGVGRLAGVPIRRPPHRDHSTLKSLIDLNTP